MPFLDFYKKHIDYYNKTVHDILTKEIAVILPNFPKNRKEKLINTVHKMHNKITWNEKLFVCTLNNWHQWYLSKYGVEHYALNSLLYITILKEKYVRMYEKFMSVKDICQCDKSSVKRLFANFSFAFNEITGNSKRSQISNPDYDIVIKRLHLYNDMMLVTFGINKERNLIVQFPVFIQPYIQQQLILYQIELVPVPILCYVWQC